MKYALFTSIILITALIGKAGEEDRPSYGVLLILADLCAILAFWSA